MIHGWNQPPDRLSRGDSVLCLSGLRVIKIGRLDSRAIEKAVKEIGGSGGR